jgi:hypothetical protein
VSRGGVRAGRKAPPPPESSVNAESDGAAQRRLRTKPPHAWRDGATKEVGDEFTSHLLTNGLGDTASEARAVGALPVSVAALLEPAREPQKMEDDVDFHSRLLGKNFVDSAWTVFTGRKGSQVTTRDALDELYIRVDQRKKPSAFQAVELPVASFGEFLNAYVVACVSQFQHKSASSLDDDSEEDLQVELGNRSQSRRTKPSPARSMTPASETIKRSQHRRRVGESIDSTETARRRLASARSAEATQKDQVKQLPKSLQHVRSKIQPELSARREKLLRVKKTQTQLMKESLARARLAEYEAQRHLEDARERAMFRKKVPLDDIPQGMPSMIACFSEVCLTDCTRLTLVIRCSSVGDRGQLCPRSSHGHFRQGRRARIGECLANHWVSSFCHLGGLRSLILFRRLMNSKRNDPVQEELYGAAPLDDSFVGCKVPKQREPVDRSKRGEAFPLSPLASWRLNVDVIRSGYNGWLGDFGPVHTKTVRHEWSDNDADDEELDREFFEVVLSFVNSELTQPIWWLAGPASKFEWNFDK